MANGNGNMTLEQAMARIKELESANAAKITVKMSDFGAGTVSVYGIRRFPLSFFSREWAKIKEVIPAVESFVAANSDKLRSAAFASEACKKAGKEWSTVTGAKNEDYKLLYAEKFALAMGDSKLVASTQK